jgi:hypothetical protein
MAEIKDCPQCGLVNPPGALQCDCGYDFTEQRPTRAYGGANVAAAEWGLCILMPPVGFIYGLVQLARGKPSGGKILGISAFMLVFWLLARLTLL